MRNLEKMMVEMQKKEHHICTRFSGTNDCLSLLEDLMFTGIFYQEEEWERGENELEMWGVKVY